MPYCCVPGCNNHSQRNKDVGYHVFPKDPTTRKAWISRIRRENLRDPESGCVCSKHFTRDCYETNLMEELTGQKIRRKLKEGSVPSVFPFGPTPKQPRLTNVARGTLQVQSKEAHLHVSTS